MKDGVALLNAIQDVYSNKTHHHRVKTAAALVAALVLVDRLVRADAARLFG